MPATEEISETQIRENIVRAVGDVFKTMLGRFAVLRPAGADAPAESGPQVVGTVGFLGDANGVIYLYFGEGFAKQCTGNMLGFDEAEISRMGEDTVNDAIGEITNMVVGVFKNGLCDAGFPCKLTIPSILRGSKFSIGGIGAVRRHLYSFECRGHTIGADILMKADE